MKKNAIHSVKGLVDVLWRDDLKAVYLMWHSEYDEGTAVKDAVLAAIKFVNQNKVKHWVADISHSSNALRDADLDWVSSDEFRNMIRSSTLEKFVMIPPLPETGQDIGWLADWEANTLKAFGDGVAAKLTSDMNDIQAFFGV